MWSSNRAQALPPVRMWGDEVTVTGIVSQTKSGYRLLPRDEADIVIRTAAAEDAQGELSALSPKAAMAPDGCSRA